ncbi:MAG: hypothetical protein AAGJ50_03610, partial [Pseudomonadota bacterium]
QRVIIEEHCDIYRSAAFGGDKDACMASVHADQMKLYGAKIEALFSGVEPYTISDVWNTLSGIFLLPGNGMAIAYLTNP